MTSTETIKPSPCKLILVKKGARLRCRARVRRTAGGNSVNIPAPIGRGGYNCGLLPMDANNTDRRTYANLYAEMDALSSYMTVPQRVPPGPLVQKQTSGAYASNIQLFLG